LAKRKTTMNKVESFISVCFRCFEAECIKKLVFSRAKEAKAQKVTARLVAHRGNRFLAFEYQLPGNTVSHKNVKKDELITFLSELTCQYSQANLITTVGDVEYKVSSSGKEALLGVDKLLNKLSGDSASFEKAIESLDAKKQYIIPSGEEFLIKLGISDKNGRVHDKKQGKYRQINRFVEHIRDVYSELPENKELTVFDLCCGKSYLSFAVYYYLTAVKGRRVKMLGIDLKQDVIAWCDSTAKALGFNGMRFVCDDVNNTPIDMQPDMVISLHACDIATDIVINKAISLGAKVILSTPCCHRYLNDKVQSSSLEFVARHPHLRNKLCEALTDAIRIARLEAAGYEAYALELTDPDDTPKNTLIRAIKKGSSVKDYKSDKNYMQLLSDILGENACNYLKEIEK